MAQALYRAYRPMSFNDVVGQDHITTVLTNELKAGKISHAYLFIGSRGTGKTTCAKLMAKAVNCLKLTDGNPCGVCAHCKGVDEGTLLDVTEIDAASNNGVDNIRDLREEAVFTPAQANYRVYIIDEVHMLSTSAFNALLKILEEPPKHVIFILATTEIHKVLPTIVSRCQRFDFHRIESDVIAKRLLSVSHKEGISLEEDAALLIAKLSEGGMRDALSLLDVSCAHSKNVTLDTVTKSAGLAGSEHLTTLLNFIIAGECEQMLLTFSSLIQMGLEPARLCEQLSGHYRNLMLAKTVSNPAVVLDCLPQEVDGFKEQSGKLSLSEIMRGLTLLQDTNVRIAKSTQKRSELEITLLTLTEPTARIDTSSLLARIERLENIIKKGVIGTATSPDPAPAPISQPAHPPLSEKTVPLVVAAPAVTVPPPLIEEDSPMRPFDMWGRVLSEMEQINSGIYAMVKTTNAYYDGRRVLIDIQNPVLLSMLKDNEFTKNVIKQAIFLVMGKNLPIGPYKQSDTAEVEKRDPLDDLIENLSGQQNIIIK